VELCKVKIYCSPWLCKRRWLCKIG